ncbi:MAG: indole-3-glycerol phosphate synthase TrpC [Bacilli bacterium]
MILDKIIKSTKKRVALDKEIMPLKTLLELVKQTTPRLPPFAFKQALIKDKPAIIAEIKKASPSVGIIVQEFKYLDIALAYEQAQVDAISILCEQEYFLGHIKYLNEVATVCNLPLLCKDFIIDEYQIYQAYYNQASAILLIARILDLETLKTFYQLAHSLKMSVLVEVHNEADIKLALAINAEIIGINNRNLKDFSIDLKTTFKLQKLIPNNVIVVSESGLNTADDYQLLIEHHVDACLIGQAFMQSNDKGQAIRTLKGLSNE